MNSKIYSIVILILISSFGLTAQTKKKYQKTFSVDKTTKLIFQTRNIDVTFKTWNKNEVKIDFSVSFKNYAPEEVQRISNEIIVTTRMESSMGDMNYLQVDNASPTSIGKLSYHLKSGEIRVENLSWEKDEPNKYKTIADINKEIDGSNKGFQDLDGYVVFKDGKVPLKDLQNSSRKEIQSIQSKYEIYVPEYLFIDLVADNATVNFEGTVSNTISGSFHESILNADVLQNENNMFSLLNGSFKVREIHGGRFMLRNMTKGLIGELENAIIETEFSKIDIGEIKKNVQFRDFKSTFFFYNLAKNFESITMFCEYSDIKLFTTKNQKYYMEAYGNNAVLTDGGTKIIVQPNRDGKKSKMFSRGKDDAETRKNTFKLDIVNGFVTLFYNK